MYEADDDAPPPLSSLQVQIEALTTKERSSGPSVATVTAARGAPDQKRTGFKKGFFDNAPSKKGSGTLKRKAKDDDDGVIHIKAPVKGPAASIPSQFILDPNTPAKQLQEVKQQLTTALQPTPELMKGVTSNPSLLHGFDDPEVMAAVSEIAKDPSAWKKYFGNAKVMAFYKEMAKFAAAQLEAKATSGSAKS